MRSELRGTAAIAPRAVTLIDALERRAAQGSAWLHFHKGNEPRVSLDGAAALSLAARWAVALAAVGVKAGDRVAVLQPNGPDFVGAFFGATWLGACAVPLPWPVMEGAPERTREDVRHVLERARPTALATTAAMATAAWGLPVVVAPSDGVVPAVVSAPDATAFIQFTSGSTGRPRGAMLSHRAALTSATAMAIELGVGAQDVGVSWIPFFHDMGLVGVLLCSLVGDFQVHVLRPAEFLMRPSRWLSLVSKERATITVGPNFGFDLALKRGGKVEGLDLSSLRLALNGSEPIHRATLDGLAQQLAPVGYRPEVMAPVYGLAEATLGVCFAVGARGGADLKFQGRDVVCVGQPLAGMELCLRRDGQVVEEGEEGEICVRGPTLMSGYFEDPEATAAAFEGEWLRTGDLGVMRDGRLHVTGREKELIIKSGQKFHPYDIERVVTEAFDTTPNGVAAFSRPHAASGSEELVVVVELRRVPPEGLAQEIRAKVMERLGVRADVVELVMAGTLPRTTSGKVKRRALQPGEAANSATTDSPLPRRGGEGQGEGRNLLKPHVTPARVLVLGGGGFLGLSFVEALKHAGIRATCGRRQRSNVLGLRALKLPLVLADLDRPETLDEALQDRDVVVHLAGHYPRFSHDPSAAIALATRQTQSLLDAAARAGVRRFIYVSSTAMVAPPPAGRDRGTEDDRYAHAPTFGTYHSVKWALEQCIDAERRFEVVTALPGACLGPHDYKLGTAAFLAALARRADVPHPDGWVSTVDVRDVALGLVELVLRPQVPSRVAFANEVWRLQDLLTSVAPRYGVDRVTPAMSADEAIAFADAEEARAAANNTRARLSRELVDMVIRGVPVDATRSRTELGLTYRPLSQTLDAFDAWALRIGLLNPPPSPLAAPAPETTA